MSDKTKIRQFIQDNLVTEDEDATFSDADNIFKLGFVNSLFAMKLVVFIENEFELEVDNDDMDIKNFSSVDNIIRLIESKTVLPNRQGQ